MTIDDRDQKPTDADIDEEFLHCWKTGDPPNLSVFFLSRQIHDATSMARVIQLDQRERSVRRCSRLAEEYFAAFPVLTEDEDASCDVIFQEFVLGEEKDPNLADRLSRRFPSFAGLLHRQIAVYRLLTSGQTMVDLPDQAQIPDDITPVDLPPGTEERFDVQELIGRGGAGSVYRAVDRALRRTVAIKVLHPDRSAARMHFQRFLSEAEIIARLAHPNIVQLFEVIRSGDELALILEYVDDGTLEDRLLQSPLSPREAARLVQTLALAVDFAHGKGIIHRDLKPSNVLLSSQARPQESPSPDGLSFTPKLADFGLAKPLSDASSGEKSRRQTITGEILGTPKYLSPEQVIAASNTFLPAIDIHALGLILFESLTGRTPFVGPTIVDYLRQIVDQEVRFTVDDQKRTPRDLQIICLKCLEKDPANRYASARELADDLGRFLDGLPILARPISSLQTVARWVQRYPVVASLGSAVLVLLTVLAIGSTVSAIWLREQTKLAFDAQRTATTLEQSRRKDLFRSLLENARSLSESGQEGQRLGAIKWLHEAMRIVPFDSAEPAVQADILNITLAAAANADIREKTTIPIGKRIVLDEESVDRDLTTLIAADPKNDRPSVQTLDNSMPSLPLMSKESSSHARNQYRLSKSARWITAHDWTGSVHRLSVWDVHARRVVWTTSSSIYLASAFHPDDRHLAYSLDGTIHVLDMERCQTVVTAPNRYIVGSLRYSPDGSRIAVGSLDGDLQIVDLSTWSSTAVACPDAIGEYVWHPREPTVLVATVEGRLYMWDVHRKEGDYLVFPRTQVTALRYSPNGAYLAVGDQISTWLCRSPGLGKVLQFQGRLIGFNQDSTKIAVVGDDQIRIAELIDPPGMRQIRVAAESSTFHPNGSILAISGKLGVKVYSTGEPNERANLHLDSTGPVTFAPDGRSMMTFGTFSGPLLWPFRMEGAMMLGPPEKLSLLPKVGELPLGLRPQHGGKQSAYLPGSRQLALVNYRNGCIELYTLADRSSRILGLLPNVGRVTCSPTGSYVAGTSPVTQRLVVWEADSSQVVLDLPGHGEASFRSDGKRLATRGISSVDVFDCNTWQQIRAIPMDVNLDTEHRPIAFQPKTHLIAIADQDRRICLIESIEGKVKAKLPVPSGNSPVSDLCFSRDGRYLSATRKDFDVILWDLVILEQSLAEFGIEEELTPCMDHPTSVADSLVTVDRGRLTPPHEWHQFWRILAAQETVEGRWTDALDSVDKAIRECPPKEGKSLAELQTLRGNLLWRCSRGEEARDAWKIAIDLSPESYHACRHLNILHAVGPPALRDIPRSLALAGILQNQDRFEQDAKILRGMAQVRQGEAKKGRETLEAVERRDAWEPAISYYLAMAYSLEGEQTKAKELLSTISGHLSSKLKADDLGIIDVASLKQEVEQRVQQPASPY